MKTEEMADLLEGFASLTEKHMSKQAIKDMRTFSTWLREFSGETVDSLCKSMTKARIGKPEEGRSKPIVDRAKVDTMVNKMNHLIDNPASYEYSQIEQLVQDFIRDFSMAEIKSVGDRLEGPASPKTKAAMHRAWLRWLESIKMGSDQDSFRFSGTGAAF